MGFAPKLIPLVLSGEKSSTWRLWDDKALTEGDVVNFVHSVTREPFAVARLLKVVEKPLGELTDEDKIGHESFASDEAMYAAYRQYYGQPVGPETMVKIIRFELR